MMDYVLTFLVDGLSLPGLVLIALPFAFFDWLSLGRRKFLFYTLGCFILMSLPVTGKALLWPLEIGVLYSEIPDGEAPAGIQAIAVISNGTETDRQIGAEAIAPTSYFRFLKAASLARQSGVPLLVSGTARNGDGKTTDIEYIQTVAQQQFQDVEIKYQGGARSTTDHVTHLVKMSGEVGASKILLLTTGHHALRSRALLRAHKIAPDPVVVGVRHASFLPTDLLPSFEGFYFWKLALKEYVGLMKYWLDGVLSISDLK
ncbi:YdcF family protein [Sneathiella aquimaris]|uniref:YdcF family protein n=1 Tax=Sneathiella aquimaris TaxID=2599305 RepID=UPI00146CFD04|nr:ElyC/SanA/YdcF family protein [Sneathiella aquimaris]